ncbi:MAG: alpha/beta fold hydrolase [Chloroflexota bacterium]
MLVVYVSLLLIVIVGALYLAKAWRQAERAAAALVYPERKPIQMTPADFGISSAETVHITVDGLTLSAWFIPPAPEKDGATLLFVHGFSGNRASLLDVAAMLHKHGYGALLLDLRNHGESEGDITTWGYDEVDDVLAAFAYLQTRPEVNSERIALFGKSMGGATVLRAAAHLPSARLIIAESAYNDFGGNMPSITFNMGGLPRAYAPLVLRAAERQTGVPLREVRPLDDIPRLAARPLLFIHGTADQLVAPSHSEAMFAAATEPKLLYLVPGAAHVGVFAADPTGYETAVIPFIDQYLSGNP